MSGERESSLSVYKSRMILSGSHQILIVFNRKRYEQKKRARISLFSLHMASGGTHQFYSFMHDVHVRMMKWHFAERVYKILWNFNYIFGKHSATRYKMRLSLTLLLKVCQLNWRIRQQWLRGNWWYNRVASIYLVRLLAVKICSIKVTKPTQRHTPAVMCPWQVFYNLCTFIINKLHLYVQIAKWQKKTTRAMIDSV